MLEYIAAIMSFAIAAIIGMVTLITLSFVDILIRRVPKIYRKISGQKVEDLNNQKFEQSLSKDYQKEKEMDVQGIKFVVE